MKKLIGVCLFLGLMSVMGFAQETPKPELFGGYQFTTLDPSWNASGWNGSATLYLNRWLGVTGDFSGAYHSGASFHTYSGGPVVVMRRKPISPFAHALFGGAHAAAGGVGDGGMVMMFGGGADYETGKRMAFRIAQFDWFTNKNNARVSTGILFRF
jgi:hypothetical protein